MNLQWVVTQASCLTCPVLLGGACVSGNKELLRYPGDVSCAQGPAALLGGLVLPVCAGWGGEEGTGTEASGVCVSPPCFVSGQSLWSGLHFLMSAREQSS